MTRQHRQDALARAYVHALAALAGVVWSRPQADYEIDLSLRSVELHEGSLDDASWQIDLQIRSTTLANVTSSEVNYDLDVEMYDKLRRRGGCPRLLVVYIMPEDESEWLEQSLHQLCLRHCAYWLSLEGAAPSSSSGKIRVFLSLTNVFSVEAIRTLLQQAKKRTPPRSSITNG
jgi:hypothetical protein